MHPTSLCIIVPQPDWPRMDIFERFIHCNEGGAKSFLLLLMLVVVVCAKVIVLLNMTSKMLPSK